MATNVRQSIATKIGTLLATIKTTASYETNLGANCFEWKEPPTLDTTLSCRWKDTVSVKKKSVNSWENIMTVTVQIQGNTSTQVRSACADVITAIGTKKTWDALAQSTEYIGEDVGMAQENKKVYVSELTFEIHFPTAYWNVYA